MFKRKTRITSRASASLGVALCNAMQNAARSNAKIVIIIWFRPLVTAKTILDDFFICFPIKRAIWIKLQAPSTRAPSAQLFYFVCKLLKQRDSTPVRSPPTIQLECGEIIFGFALVFVPNSRRVESSVVLGSFGARGGEHFFAPKRQLWNWVLQQYCLIRLKLCKSLNTNDMHPSSSDSARARSKIFNRFSLFYLPIHHQNISLTCVSWHFIVSVIKFIATSDKSFISVSALHIELETFQDFLSTSSL